jgi:hypothetical protein
MKTGWDQLAMTHVSMVNKSPWIAEYVSVRRDILVSDAIQNAQSMVKSAVSQENVTVHIIWAGKEVCVIYQDVQD